MTLAAPTPPSDLRRGAALWTLRMQPHAGRQAGGTPIITATITDAGVYKVTLTGPIDHPIAGQGGIRTFTVPVTSPTAWLDANDVSVTIEDDSPTADRSVPSSQLRARPT